MSRFEAGSLDTDSIMAAMAIAGTSALSREEACRQWPTGSSVAASPAALAAAASSDETRPSQPPTSLRPTSSAPSLTTSTAPSLASRLPLEGVSRSTEAAWPAALSQQAFPRIDCLLASPTNLISPGAALEDQFTAMSGSTEATLDAGFRTSPPPSPSVCRSSGFRKTATLCSSRRKRARDCDGQVPHSDLDQPLSQRAALSGRSGRWRQLQVRVPIVDLSGAASSQAARALGAASPAIDGSGADGNDLQAAGRTCGQQQFTPTADLLDCCDQAAACSPAREARALRCGEPAAAPLSEDVLASPAASPPASGMSATHRAFVRHLLAAATAAEELRASGQRIRDETSTRTLGCILRSVASDCGAADLAQATAVLTLPSLPGTQRGGLQRPHGAPDARLDRGATRPQPLFQAAQACGTHSPGIATQPERQTDCHLRGVPEQESQPATAADAPRKQQHDHAEAPAASRAGPAAVGDASATRAQAGAPRHSETATPEATPMASPAAPAFGRLPWSVPSTAAPLRLGEHLCRQASGEAPWSSFSGKARLSSAFRSARASGTERAAAELRIADFGAMPELGHCVAQERQQPHSPTRAAAEEWRRALAGPESPPLFSADSPCPSPSAFLASSRIGPFSS